MTDKQKKKSTKQPPKLESAPIKFWHKDNQKQVKAEVRQVEEQGKGSAFFTHLKAIAGVKDSELAANIIDTASSAIEPIVHQDDRLNVVIQALHDFGPKDAIEARLVVQSTSLFTHGMKCLRRTETADMMCHGEYYANKAIKLLRLHNETIEALTRYRRGGEQKITVQHNVIADKAIVNFGAGGVNTKNEGENPCSGNYAELKQEPTVIDHVDSPRWPMEDVDSTGANAQVPRQRKESGE